MGRGWVIRSRTHAKEVAESRSNPIRRPGAKSDGLGTLPHRLCLSSAIPTWFMSLSPNPLIRETLKTPFSLTVFACILSVHLPKRLVSACPLLLWQTWPCWRGAALLKPKDMLRDTYPNGAAWEWRARPGSSSLGVGSEGLPRSRHPSSNPQTPASLPPMAQAW